MDTDSTGAENALPEEEVPRKLGRPPPIMMTFATNIIQLQSDLKTMSNESMSSKTHEMEPYNNKRYGRLFSNDILPGK
jgi:hypothetical protein